MSKPTKQRKKPASQLERRYLPASQSGTFEIRKSGVDGKSRTIVGYAAKFGVLSQDLGNFREKLDAHCFDKCLASSPDVRCLFNHDTNQPPLGRTSSGTLRLSVNSTGLFYECDAADNQMTSDIIVSMERGDISQSSFGFTCSSDSWNQMPDGSIVRTVLEAEIFDVSPVNFGAYTQATSGVRAALRSAPAEILARLNVRSDDSEDDDPSDHPGQHWDDEESAWVDDSESGDDDDSSDWDDRSTDFKCQYRCQQCSERTLNHLSNLAEDNPDARSKRFTKSDPRLSDSEFATVEAKRCSFRCAECRAIGHGYSISEDDQDARAAHLHLLGMRLR
jgi:HK97 family phage prohead protease